MPISLSPSLMREIIMDHYSNPSHKRKPSGDGYLKVHSSSINCIDDIDVYILIKDGKIIDCCFDGVACAISTASTDIMCDLVIGKDENFAKKILQEYLNMIYEKDYDSELLDEANAFQNTHKQAARIKCATIGWNSLDELFKIFDEANKNG